MTPGTRVLVVEDDPQMTRFLKATLVAHALRVTTADGVAAGAARDDVAVIRDAGNRAAALTAQLLAFSRRTIIAPRPLELTALVARLARMLERILGEHIALVTRLAPGLPTVMADAGQLEQVLLNLAVNARDAMPGGGTLRVGLAAQALGQAEAAPRLVPPGDYLAFRVHDTGAGMDEATVAQAFEPFFTTKGPDRGTGLGLAPCHGIVTQAGGAIWLDSQPGRGATVTFLLPRHTGPVGQEPARPPPAAGGAEVLLVVEDEEAVRAVAARALGLLGYRVLVARSLDALPPQTARSLALFTDGDATFDAMVADIGAARDHVHLELYIFEPDASGARLRDALVERARAGVAVRLLVAAAAGRLDLLVTDLVLPRLDGHQLARRLLEARPGLRVLYTSGYSDQAPSAAAGAFLQKPYTPGELGRAVRGALQGAAPPDGQRG